MSSIDSRAPAICRLRTTPPISISCGLVETLRRGLDGKRLRPCRARRCRCCRRQARGRLRSGICWRRPARSNAFALASTAKCFASLAKGTPRARPDRLPSALSVMRSLGVAGVTVISPSGEEIFACASSQPASMVSASGTAMREAAGGVEHAQSLRPGSRRSRHNPRGTQASGSPASLSACHSGAFHAPFLSRLMVWASARSAKIFSAVSTTMFSLSATAFPDVDWRPPAAVPPGRARSFLALYDEEKP